MKHVELSTIRPAVRSVLQNVLTMLKAARGRAQHLNVSTYKVTPGLEFQLERARIATLAVYTPPASPLQTRPGPH